MAQKLHQTYKDKLEKQRLAENEQKEKKNNKEGSKPMGLYTWLQQWSDWSEPPGTVLSDEVCVSTLRIRKPGSLAFSIPLLSLSCQTQMNLLVI